MAGGCYRHASRLLLAAVFAGFLAAGGGSAAAQPAGTARTGSERIPDRVTGVPGPYGETLTIDDEGITLTFPDDLAKLRIGGRLHLDYGAASVAQPGFGEPFSDNIAVRRSWIESTLTIGKTLELAFQYDFADAMEPINDAVIAFRASPDVLISFGNMKEPFSLDQLGSNNDTLFAERSLADAFAPARNVGAAIGRHGESWTAVASVFGGNINTGVDKQGVAAAGRITCAPVLEDGQVLHLGLAGSYRSLQRDSDDVSFSNRAGAFLFRRMFVDTDTIDDASAIGLIGVEAAYAHGPFLLQAEYIDATVDRSRGGQSLSFRGGYVQGSVVLNGKGRRYKLTPDYGTTYAIFAGVEVEEAQRVTRGGFGVFELGVRLSAIDLQDADVQGGVGRDVTVGLNWYPDKNIRIVADYVRSHTSPSAIRGFRRIDAGAFIGRFQLYW